MDAPTSLDLRELSPELRQLVENELDRDEKLLWVTQPDPRAARRGFLPIQLFAIPWTAFALFWIAGAAGFEVPDFQEGFDLFPLFGIPFVLIGLGMLSSPWWAGWLARKTVYAITDGRAILFENQWNGVSIRSFRPDQLGSLERKQHRDGTGDLVFTREVTGHGENGPHIRPVGFKGIRQVKQVEDLLEALVESVG